MASEIGEELRSTWMTFESFRNSVTRLIEAGPERIRAWFPDQLRDGPAVEVTEDEAAAAAVVTWLAHRRSPIADGTVQVQAFGELIASEAPHLAEGFGAIRSELERLLFESVEDRRARRIAQLETVAIPNLTRADTTIDLRVDRSLIGSGDIGLVPVTILRLSFDEPIAGQLGIVCQLTRPALEEIIAELRECADHIDSIAGDLVSGTASVSDTEAYRDER